MKSKLQKKTQTQQWRLSQSNPNESNYSYELTEAPTSIMQH